jgi:hypothetical protein
MLTASYMLKQFICVLLPHGGRSSAAPMSTALTSSSRPLVSGEGRSGAAHRKTSPHKQKPIPANGVTVVKPLCWAYRRFGLSLDVLQLLGPDGGFNVVALEDGVTHGRKLGGCNAPRLPCCFQKPKSAKAQPPCSSMCRVHHAAYRKMNLPSQALPLRVLRARLPDSARPWPWMGSQTYAAVFVNICRSGCGS